MSRHCGKPPLRSVEKSHIHKPRYLHVPPRQSRPRGAFLTRPKLGVVCLAALGFFSVPLRGSRLARPFSVPRGDLSRPRGAFLTRPKRGAVCLAALGFFSVPLRGSRRARPFSVEYWTYGKARCGKGAGGCRCHPCTLLWYFRSSVYMNEKKRTCVF